MATPKKASTKKAATKVAKTTTRKRVAKSFTVSVQLPGQPAEKKSVKAGTTLADFSKDLNLDGYIVRLNSREAAASTELQKDDVIRIGIKTKQG